jgi:hypothetical protein
MTDSPIDPAAPQVLTGLSLSPERFAEVTAAFVEIRVEIDRLRTLDLGETHPAVVFQPVVAKEA